MDILGKMREARAAKKAELDAILAKETPEEGDVARADALLDEIKSDDARIAAYAETVERQAAAMANKEETGIDEPVVRGSAVVTREERTYHDGNDRSGALFLQDVLRAQFSNDIEAQQRLGRHMSEERVERGEYLEGRAATGTANFAGLVVPQYLTDMVAPYAKAARPFADAVRSHDLPAAGMTVNISRITTATSAAVQTQGTDVSETNIDDTLLTVSVQTIAGSQTVTRQAIERGTSVLDTVLEDLVTSYHSQLDYELLNQATNGLATVATGITWTDNTDPTAVELWPKIWQGNAAVEVALKNQSAGDVIVVMHPRRWAWINAALSSSSPLLAQVGSPAGVNAGGADFGARYGSGFRGTIGGLPVVVDANVVTNLGAATNQDEVYVLAANESHLWEDSNAPLFIRTDTGPSVKSLGVDLVVYGYSAFTHARYSGASQRITGSGLVTPTF